MEFGGNWEEHLSLVEFMYNNSYQTTIGMAPFEALYGRKCRTPLCWEEVGIESYMGQKKYKSLLKKLGLLRIE